MKRCKLVLATFVAVCAAAGAQVVPSINGPELPLSGTLRYDLRYAQIAQFYGGSQGNSQTSSLSGDLSYANSNPAFPFGLTYSAAICGTSAVPAGKAGYFSICSLRRALSGANGLSSSAMTWIIFRKRRPRDFPASRRGRPAKPDNPAGQSVLTLNTRSVTNTTIANLSRSIGRATA